MSSPVSKHANRLVIGIGNRYRHDDGVGPWVVEALRPHAPANVVCFAHDKDGLDLMERWRDAPRVYVVDATQSGQIPGTITRFDARQQPLPVSFFRYSSHAFALAEAVELARALDVLPPELVIIGIEGRRWDAGEGLTPEATAAARHVTTQLAKILGIALQPDTAEAP